MLMPKTRSKTKNEEPKKTQTRSGKPLNVWLPVEIHDALTAFISAQRIPPSTTDTVEVAIQEFLIREGFTPAKKAE